MLRRYRFLSGGTAKRWLRNAACLLGYASCERTFGICRIFLQTDLYLLAFSAKSSLVPLLCEPGFSCPCGCCILLHVSATLLLVHLSSSSTSSTLAVPRLPVKFFAHHRVPRGLDLDCLGLLLSSRSFPSIRNFLISVCQFSSSCSILLMLRFLVLVRFLRSWVYSALGLVRCGRGPLSSLRMPSLLSNLLFHFLLSVFVLPALGETLHTTFLLLRIISLMLVLLPRIFRRLDA